MNIHSASIKGLRPQNEDAHEIVINIDGKDPTKNDINLYAVFDGHGGKEVSSFVKENLPKFFMEKNTKLPLRKEYVYTVYDHIQNTLKSHKFSYTSGSTGLIVLHFKINDDTYLNIMNNGDSRCVLCRDNFAMPLTKDHKPNWPEEAYRIIALGGKIEADDFGELRIKDLSVSRAFGDLDATPFVTHRPELFRYKLDKCDKFIVIACDGAYEVLSNSDIINFVLFNCYDSTLKTRINDNVNIAKKLAEYALKKGSGDNISVIVVFFD